MLHSKLFPAQEKDPSWPTWTPCRPARSAERWLCTTNCCCRAPVTPTSTSSSGSLAYVAGLSTAERELIRSVVNLDMIASLNAPQPTVLLAGASLSQHLIDELARAAATYTTPAVQTSLHPLNSDHVPFLEKCIPAVLTIEGADSTNANIHSARDTLDSIDYDLALEILRMNVAATARLLGSA
ncbi:M28 family peptidase [Rhodococcus pyridinivorans]|nr:M28 family peptidase [Rhodococcus rhodochrous]WAL48908.1 M28 family peptidase [Rhodococcus pyridinivorans]